MKQRKLTFQQVVARIEAAKVPCTVKRYGYNDEVHYTVEMGTNWPVEFVDDINKAFDAFGETVPSYISLCGSSCCPDLTAKKTIAGGPKRYAPCYY